MAKRKSAGGSGAGKFLLGFLLAVVLAAVALVVCFRFGTLPVAVADAPFPFEREIVHMPLSARIGREIKQPPFGISEDVFEAGARVYRTECASCHGTPGQDAAFARHMYPAAPQLWKRHSHGSVVGVSDDEVGETYWKVANGIRLSGMPSYKAILTDTQMWQVSLLLKSADQPLPDPVEQILNGKR